MKMLKGGYSDEILDRNSIKFGDDYRIYHTGRGAPI